MKALITCPPMLGQRDHFLPLLAAAGIEAVCPDVVQTLSEDELVDLLPTVDGWILGDDPATARVLEAGHRGLLRAVVKWGVGTDNVDFDACRRLGIPATNTPGMFGHEVADVAMAYLVMVWRHLAAIDRDVRAGLWPKPAGRSVAGRRVGVVGHGDVGRQIVRRLDVAAAQVTVYDPGAVHVEAPAVHRRWPDGLDALDALVLAAPLNASTRHLVDADALAAPPPGLVVVNVGRGPVVDEAALEAALASGHVAGAALDVFEDEPLPATSPLRDHPRVVLGSHNASNTADAVRRTNEAAVAALVQALGADR